MKNKITADLYMHLALKARYFQFKYFYIATIKRDFRKSLGYELNLDNPKTFNEKIQWLKIYYREPMMPIYADKYAVREIIKEKWGEEYLNELYGVYDNASEIDFNELPERFVLKPTHSSGRIIICTNKNKLNYKKTYKTMKRWLKENYFYQGGEWVYKNIPPRIICEKLIEENIVDYKVYCFNGRALYTQVITNRNGNNFNVNYFDLQWRPIEVKRLDHKPNPTEIARPYNYDKMIYFSEMIAKDYPFIRMDYYEVEKKLYFGEVTFFPANGFIKFSSKEEDEKWGKYLKLPMERCLFFS